MSVFSFQSSGKKGDPIFSLAPSTSSEVNAKGSKKAGATDKAAPPPPSSSASAATVASSSPAHSSSSAAVKNSTVPKKQAAPPKAKITAKAAPTPAPATLSKKQARKAEANAKASQERQHAKPEKRERPSRADEQPAAAEKRPRLAAGRAGPHSGRFKETRPPKGSAAARKKEEEEEDDDGDAFSAATAARRGGGAVPVVSTDDANQVDLARLVSRFSKGKVKRAKEAGQLAEEDERIQRKLRKAKKRTTSHAQRKYLDTIGSFSAAKYMLAGEKSGAVMNAAGVKEATERSVALAKRKFDPSKESFASFKQSLYEETRALHKLSEHSTNDAVAEAQVRAEKLGDRVEREDAAKTEREAAVRRVGPLTSPSMYVDAEGELQDLVMFNEVVDAPPELPRLKQKMTTARRVQQQREINLGQAAEEATSTFVASRAVGRVEGIADPQLAEFANSVRERYRAMKRAKRDQAAF